MRFASNQTYTQHTAHSESIEETRQQKRQQCTLTRHVSSVGVTGLRMPFLCRPTFFVCPVYMVIVPQQYLETTAQCMTQTEPRSISDKFPLNSLIEPIFWFIIRQN